MQEDSVEKIIYLASMSFLQTSLQHFQHILYIAPTGSGKTFQLFQMLKDVDREFIFVSPLRALAEEVYLSALDKNISVINYRSNKEVANYLRNKVKIKLQIITPELIDESYLSHFDDKAIFILDELHLFFIWGSSFRPHLWNLYSSLILTEQQIIGLTATFTEEMEAFYQYFSWHKTKTIICNLGNFRNKSSPSKTYPSINTQFYIKEKHSTLIFCKYRKEVFDTVKHLKEAGKSVISCVGGEVESFQKCLYQNQRPDFIVATNVLSHGVNLPKISVIYFNYKVSCQSIYIQMLGRGGRQGEEFIIFTRNIGWTSFLFKIIWVIYWHKWRSILEFRRNNFI